MAALLVGTELMNISGIGIDSLLPQLRTSSKTLVKGTDQRTQWDPTSGDLTATLPDAVTNPGVLFWLKRVTNGGNAVNLEAAGSDSIDGTTNGYTLALINEYIGVYSDGTTEWKIYAKDIFSIATITATAASFTVTTSPTKFTSWDTVAFSTPQKLIGNLTTDVIDILEFQGPIADGYTVNATFAFIYTNNKLRKRK